MKNMLKKVLVILGVISIFFIIDILCIFTLNRPLFAIKKDKFSYKGIFYDTYNCSEFSVPQIKVKGTKFSCLDLDRTSIFLPTEVKNVSIKISNISSTGATIIIKDENDQPYTYGEWYKIEKNIDGKWNDVKTIIDNYGFNDIAYLVDNNHEKKFVIDWEWSYGKLSPGNYRLIKKVNNKQISVEFKLAEINYTDNSKMDFYIIKPEYHNDIKFNEYYKESARKIFLAGNISNIYITNGTKKDTLNKYLSNNPSKISDTLEFMTSKLDKENVLKDGGTTIYKSKDKDVTMIVCNTIDKTYDIYIGDFSMNYEQFMCR